MPRPNDSVELIAIGRVRNAHGIRGELVVEVLTDAPGTVFVPGRRVFMGTERGILAPDGSELHVVRASKFKDGLIVSFKELTTRNAAEVWRDRLLLAPADELEPPAEHELYIHDLVGMRVVLQTGTDVGEIIEVFELPQGLVLDVRRTGGGTVMIPFHGSAVSFVDRDQRVVHIDPPEGLLD